MRRTVLALLAVGMFVVACSPPAGAPDAEPAAAAVAAPVMPADAPPQEEVDPALAALGSGEAVPFSGRPTRGSCRDEIGDVASARLVERCIAVSPATHPPCNVANACETIQGEIDRSCEMYRPGEVKPAECAA